MNRRIRRLAGMLLVLLVLLQAAGVSALAVEETYQIRIYAGNVGATISGGTVLQLTGTYGENITFSPDWVQLPADSKYYVRGVRESGLDNNTVSNNVIHVTEDADYVVAYGIRGKLVAYTVNYVDTNGNTLAPSQTYYGNAGDKPVVAYLYVDGYQPQAYNLTKTLSENEASNVFTFVYTEIVVVTPTPAPTATPAPSPVPAPQSTAAPTAAPAAGEGTDQQPEPTAEAGATAAPGPTADAGENAPADTAGQETAAPGEEEAAPDQETAAPDQEAAASDEEEAEAAPTEAPTTEPTPEQAEIEEEQTPLDDVPDLIDLDDEDTPLGQAPEAEKEKTDLQKDREQKQTKFYVSAGLLVAALAVIVAMVLVLLKKRGKQS